MDVKDRLFDDDDLMIGVWILSETVSGNAKKYAQGQICKSGLPEEMRMKEGRYRLSSWTVVSEDVISDVSLAAD